MLELMYLVQGKLQLQEGEAEPFPGEKKTDQKGGESMLLSRWMAPSSRCLQYENHSYEKLNV